MYGQALRALETSLFLDCSLSTTPSVKPSFMTSSIYVLDSSYYTKLELQDYFLTPRLNDKHFEFNNTLFITISAYLAQCSTSPFTRHIEWRDMSIDNVRGFGCTWNLGSGSFVLWSQQLFFPDHPLSSLCALLYYFTYYYHFFFLIWVPQPEFRAQKKLIHAGELYESFFLFF